MIDATRARIVTSATDVFRASGSSASLREVARRAGVGIGTVYRHFPQRADLISEVTRELFDSLSARAAELAGQGRPEDALFIWLDEFAATTSSMDGLAEAIVTARRNPDSALFPHADGMIRAGESLLARAKSAGGIRDDIDAVTLFALAGGIAWISRLASDIVPRERMFELVRRSTVMPA
ncbi:MAG TPA: TetR/AcrR family transcriptional regulator [Pseudolysinimonas sp.]|nr:TetR/AcrR family transcriptional regulator [Pseudolysinimonas sp.]